MDLAKKYYTEDISRRREGEKVRNKSLDFITKGWLFQ